MRSKKQYVLNPVKNNQGFVLLDDSRLDLDKVACDDFVWLRDRSKKVLWYESVEHAVDFLNAPCMVSDTVVNVDFS